MVLGSTARGRARRRTPGQFFTVTEPITHETIARIRAATRQLVDRNASAEQGSRPILVFEFLSGETAPGEQRIRRLLRPGELDLQGPGGRQADGRLRAAAAQRLRRPARGRLYRDRDGIDGVAGPDHARGPAVRRRAARAGPVPRHAQDARPRPLAGDARPRRRPPTGPHGRQGRALRPGREHEGLRPVPPGDRGAARLGRRPARRADREPGTRGRVLQANRRKPRRAGQHLPDRRTLGDRGPDPRPVDPTRSGSSSRACSTTSRSHP